MFAKRNKDPSTVSRNWMKVCIVYEENTGFISYIWKVNLEPSPYVHHAQIGKLVCRPGRWFVLYRQSSNRDRWTNVGWRWWLFVRLLWSRCIVVALEENRTVSRASMAWTLGSYDDRRLHFSIFYQPTDLAQFTPILRQRHKLPAMYRLSADLIGGERSRVSNAAIPRYPVTQPSPSGKRWKDKWIRDPW